MMIKMGEKSELRLITKGWIVGEKVGLTNKNEETKRRRDEETEGRRD